VTPKTKTHIYYAIVKSKITYTAKTWCLKAKMVAKLNSTKMYICGISYRPYDEEEEEERFYVRNLHTATAETLQIWEKSLKLEKVKTALT